MTEGDTVSILINKGKSYSLSSSLSKVDPSSSSDHKEPKSLVCIDGISIAGVHITSPSAELNTDKLDTCAYLIRPSQLQVPERHKGKSTIWNGEADCNDENYQVKSKH